MMFLLLNHLSHDAHFSTRQNMETFQFSEKFKFYLHSFSGYWTPNMAIQKIILYSFYHYYFLLIFFFLNRGPSVHFFSSRRIFVEKARHLLHGVNRPVGLQKIFVYILGMPADVRYSTKSKMATATPYKLAYLNS